MADASGDPEALLGSQIGDYRIIAILGAGTMGIVYAAEHVTLGHRTACKVLRPEIMQQTDAVERFRQEVQKVSQIRHNNLVDIFDIGELPDGRLYYVMEYLAGQPLTKVLTKGPLKFSEIMSLGRQVCAGLSAAHAAGLVHRDLSPDNLFLCERPAAPPLIKITNFGVAEVRRLFSDGNGGPPRSAERLRNDKNIPDAKRRNGGYQTTLVLLSAGSGLPT